MYYQVNGIVLENSINQLIVNINSINKCSL
jgi:hypothetical protein